MFEWLNDHPYTCPLLMAIQAVVLRQKWVYSSEGWVVMSSPRCCAACMFPRWLILTECRLWNSRLGLYLRYFAGSRQREYRLSRTP